MFRSLFSKGAKYIPTPQPTSDSKLHWDLYDYIRRLKWCTYFRQVENNNPDRVPIAVSSGKLSQRLVDVMLSSSCRIPSLPGNAKSKSPQDSSLPDRLVNFTSDLFNRFGRLFLAENCRPLHPNMSREEMLLLKQLQNHPDWVCLLSDKNLGITVLPRYYYRCKCLRTLNNPVQYRPLAFRQVREYLIKVKAKLDSLLLEFRVPHKFWAGPISSCIPSEESEFKKKLPRFHMLPKLHKTPIAWRPIIGAHTHFFKGIDKLISIRLREIVSAIPYIVESSNKVASYLSSIRLTTKPTLVQFDVVEMYPTVDPKETYLLIKDLFADINFPDAEFLLKMLDILLNSFFFKYDVLIFRQNKGLPMGICCSPELANLVFYLKFEKALGVPRMAMNSYFRFLDDGFFIWEGTQEYLDAFIELFHNLDPQWRFKFDTSPVSLDFLDLTISVKEYGEQWRLEFKPFSKPFSTFPYIASGSAHPPHTTRAWISTELARLSRLSSDIAFFNSAAFEFNKHLQVRGYNRAYLAKIFNDFSHVGQQYLSNLDTLLNFNNVHLVDRFAGTSIPRSLCLPQVVFKTRYTLRHTRIHMGSLLRETYNDHQVQDLVSLPIVCYSVHPNILQRLSSHHLSFY